MALPGAIDHAHAAAADLFQDFVIAEAPVLVGQSDFGQNVVECLRFVLVTSVQPSFEQTTDAKAAGDLRQRFAMRTTARLVEHAGDGIGQSRGERRVHAAVDSAASTPQRWRISSPIPLRSATVSATTSRSKVR